MSGRCRNSVPGCATNNARPFLSGGAVLSLLCRYGDTRTRSPSFIKPTSVTRPLNSSQRRYGYSRPNKAPTRQ